ncbi:hypothetical protein P7K49_010834 [Saguinus oedipus]|uniref:Uncharacterized protein n=1 Tax=Saguinus oedipus TaxID=9490 RepID=A0ABQ9VNY7_SAGOE|nr:hypothetical protein P7K49_010834 [Saguinus oedipus]
MPPSGVSGGGGFAKSQQESSPEPNCQPGGSRRQSTKPESSLSGTPPSRTAQSTCARWPSGFFVSGVPCRHWPTGLPIASGHGPHPACPGTFQSPAGVLEARYSVCSFGYGSGDERDRRRPAPGRRAAAGGSGQEAASVGLKRPGVAVRVGAGIARAVRPGRQGASAPLLERPAGGLRRHRIGGQGKPVQEIPGHIFNKGECQNCFKPRESHLLNYEDVRQVSCLARPDTSILGAAGQGRGRRGGLREI